MGRKQVEMSYEAIARAQRLFSFVPARFPLLIWILLHLTWPSAVTADADTSTADLLELTRVRDLPVGVVATAGACGERGGAYSFLSSAVLTAEAGLLFSSTFPTDFSIIVTAKAARGSGQEALFTVYGDSGEEQLSVSIGTDISLYYADEEPEDPDDNLVSFDVNIDDGQWHRMGFSLKGDSVTLILDCGRQITRRLIRKSNEGLNTAGIVLVGQELEGEGYFTGEIELLLIIDNPAAGYEVCTRYAMPCSNVALNSYTYTQTGGLSTMTGGSGATSQSRGSASSYDISRINVQSSYEEQRRKEAAEEELKYNRGAFSVVEGTNSAHGSVSIYSSTPRELIEGGYTGQSTGQLYNHTVVRHYNRTETHDEDDTTYEDYEEGTDEYDDHDEEDELGNASAAFRGQDTRRRRPPDGRERKRPPPPRQRPTERQLENARRREYDSTRRPPYQPTYAPPTRVPYPPTPYPDRTPYYPTYYPTSTEATTTTEAPRPTEPETIESPQPEPEEKPEIPPENLVTPRAPDKPEDDAYITTGPSRFCWASWFSWSPWKSRSSW